jgi:hypothetical protein
MAGMKTFLSASALLFAFSCANAQQASPTMEQLQEAASGTPPSTVYDGASQTPVLQPVAGSTDSVSGQADGMLDATPVVSVKPRQEKFEKWAEKEGGNQGLKWGLIGGGVLGAIGGGIAFGLLLHPLGWAALAVGLGIFGAVLGLGALGGWLLGRYLGNKKAEELKAGS